MMHGLFLAVLLPLLAGIVQLLVRPLAVQRRIGLTVTGLLLLVGVWLFISVVDGSYRTYHLGNWLPPFGIVLVLDRLSALMLLLTALVATGSLLYAVSTEVDERGSFFHALFQFQLFGLNGAFLTGDLFNLFVFFEILLIASYGLLLHGGGRRVTRAGLHYVVLNLAGSTLFLFAVGVLYGITGTLNMADLALRVATADPADSGLLRASGLILLVVFALKAALLPLYFWLPKAYGSTSAPVAALFAIMTKVGIYSIIRVYTLIFGPQAGVVANVADPWVLPLALATLIAGTLGVLSSRNLRQQLAYFVVVSVGTLLVAVGLFSEIGLTAALVYMIHTTLVTAGMFLLADLIGRQRGGLDMTPAPGVAQPLLLGVLFFGGAAALTGLPPLSGFLAKLMILQAAGEGVAGGWSWGVILSTSLLGVVALSRSGSALFWGVESGLAVTPRPASLWQSTPALALLALSPLLVALGSPVTGFAEATARQLGQPGEYIEQVLGRDHIDQWRTRLEE